MAGPSKKCPQVTCVSCGSSKNSKFLMHPKYNTLIVSPPVRRIIMFVCKYKCFRKSVRQNFRETSCFPSMLSADLAVAVKIGSRPTSNYERKLPKSKVIINKLFKSKPKTVDKNTSFFQIIFK